MEYGDPKSNKYFNLIFCPFIIFSVKFLIKVYQKILSPNKQRYFKIKCKI